MEPHRQVSPTEQLRSTARVIPLRSAPAHLGLIAGGLKRWATSRKLPEGVAVVAAIQRTIEAADFCLQQRIRKLTIYVITADLEVHGTGASNVLALVLRDLRGVTASLDARGIRLHIIGNTEQFDEELRRLISDAERRTINNTKLTLNISIDGARDWDVTAAFKCWQATHTERASGSWGPETLRPYAMSAQLPDPNLVVRTGGDLPADSNMIWDTQSTALYFTPTPWPDFDATALSKATIWYRRNNRANGILIPRLRAT